MATSNAQLQTYIWRGTRRGKKVSGEIRAASDAVVSIQLRKQGVIVTSVKKKSRGLFSGGGGSINPLDIAMFTRQMATMTKAGVPLVQGLQMVADGTQKLKLKELIQSLHEEVSSGNSFASALKKYPRQFDDLYCSLIDAGEQSGALETLLDRVATYKEKTEALKPKIRKAMTYPAVVIVVAIGVTILLMVKVIPTFAESFRSFGADLPAFTLFVLGISETVQEWWWMIVLGLVGGVFAFREGRLRSRRFRMLTDRLTLKLPVVGNIVYEAIVARFARTLATTFSAGVPLVESLTAVARSSGNLVFEEAIMNVRDEVTAGIQLHASLRNTRLFPALALQMTEIGEESGSLDDLLEKVADHYEDSVDEQVSNLTTLLEPVIMVILGVLVGGLLVAMYLPIFNLGKVI